VGGAGVALLFNLPFVFVTKAEQLHVVALGAILTLTGGILAVIDALNSRVVQKGGWHLSRKGASPLFVGFALAMTWAVAAAGVCAMCLVTRQITRDFEPFGPIVLSNDTIVRQWAVVPQEMRDYLAAKREPGAAQRLSPNPAAVIPQIVFGAHGRETTPGGISYRWMAGTRTDILVSSNARTITIPIRNAIDVFREPAHATIEANGRLIDRMDLNTPEWRVSRSALPRPIRLFGMHRIVISIDHAWRPSRGNPASRDDRVLGLQLGEIVTTADAPR
jgi:hypothetical protein